MKNTTLGEFIQAVYNKTPTEKHAVKTVVAAIRRQAVKFKRYGRAAVV